MILSPSSGRGGVCSTSGRLGLGAGRTVAPRAICNFQQAFRRSGVVPCVAVELDSSRLSPRHASARKGRRLSLACNFSMAVTGALSSYDIPKQEVSVGTPVWLSNCIAEAAKHLEQAPFLQLMLSARAQNFEHYPVPSEVVQAPQLWYGIAEHLSKTTPDVLVLIHPIQMASVSHSQRALKAARESVKLSPTDVLTGIAVGEAPPRKSWQEEHAERMRSCARLMESGLAYPALSGRVGDCCDGEDELPQANNIVPVSRPVEVRKTVTERDSKTGREVEYWGVVVQSKHSSSADGCYVLKTIRNADSVAHCTCVHYSLVHVCKGEAYGTQMAASWLI